MKKIILPLVIAVLTAVLLPCIAMMASAETDAGADTSAAESEVSIPEDTPVSYGYLMRFKEELRQELIAELTAEGGITVATTYEDISAKEGQVLLLAANCEVIYRGGGAVALTSSSEKDHGLTDMSSGSELFSGESLEYGHIYNPSASEDKKAILVTGGTAYFTVRGDYEIV